MQGKQVLIWDWNGTIVDDVGIALDAVNEMLAAKSRPKITLESYRKAMATPILRFYEQFFDMRETDFSWITQQFQTYYREQGARLRLQEGAAQMIHRASVQGCRQVVLSSSATEAVCRDARRFGVDAYFEEILGAQDYLAAGKVERAISYFERANILQEQAVLIGDTVHDYEVSQALGIACILLCGGHQDAESLRACGCPVYETVPEAAARCL